MLVLQIQHFGLYPLANRENFAAYVAANNRAAIFPVILAALALTISPADRGKHRRLPCTRKPPDPLLDRRAMLQCSLAGGTALMASFLLGTRFMSQAFASDSAPISRVIVGAYSGPYRYAVSP